MCRGAKAFYSVVTVDLLSLLVVSFLALGLDLSRESRVRIESGRRKSLVGEDESLFFSFFFSSRKERERRGSL